MIRWNRVIWHALLGITAAAAVILVVWLTPQAFRGIANAGIRRSAEVGTRVIVVALAVFLFGAALDRSRRSWWFWAAAGVGGLVFLAGIVLLVWLVPPALYRDVDDPTVKAGAEASTRTGIIAGVAGIAALGGLAVTARTYRLTQQGQITDRYTKAIEQLGADTLDVRLGGVYALERIAVDSKRDHPTVVEVLSAFVRVRTDPAHVTKPTLAEVIASVLTASEQQGHDPLAAAADAKPKPAADIQAALTVLARLPRRQGVSRGDLTGASVAGAILIEAYLADAALDAINLSDATCGVANLSGAYLRGADLSRSWLGFSDLSNAQLDDSTLSGTRLLSADLSGVQFGNADLSRARLNDADLSRAYLGGANLSGTRLGGADLSRATGLSQEQIDEAIGDERTKLPGDLRRPATWTGIDTGVY